MNVRVTTGCDSTSSLNAIITLSALANMLSGDTCGSAPLSISSRGCGSGFHSCAAASVSRKTIKRRHNRLMFIKIRRL